MTASYSGPSLLTFKQPEPEGEHEMSETTSQLYEAHEELVQDIIATRAVAATPAELRRLGFKDLLFLLDSIEEIEVKVSLPVS